MSFKFFPKAAGEFWTADLSTELHGHNGFDLILMLDKVVNTEDSGWMLELAIDRSGAVSGQITARPGYDALALFECSQDTMVVRPNTVGPAMTIRETGETTIEYPTHAVDQKAPSPLDVARMVISLEEIGSAGSGFTFGDVVMRARAALKEAETRPMVYTLTIDHKHGTDVRVFQSERGALDALAAWVREWWPTEVARWKDQAEGMTQEAFDALPDEEAISEYFERMNGFESYSLNSATLED